MMSTDGMNISEKERRAQNHDGLDAHSVIRSAQSSHCPSMSSQLQAKEIYHAARRPVERRDYTIDELSQFDGSNPGVAILVAVRGLVYDVSSREDLYGISGPYSWIAGRDASIALAKMKKIDSSDTTTMDQLDEKQNKALEDWHAMFDRKYQCLGRLVLN